MTGVYKRLRDELNRAFDLFRLKLLVYNLVKGALILCCVFIILLLLYYFIDKFFQINVLFKTIYFYLFISILLVIFLFFIIRPFFQYFLSLKLKNDLLWKSVVKYSSVQQDLFLTVFNLAYHSDKIKGDEGLKKAAFIQKYEYLRKTGSLLIFPDKLLFSKGLLLFVTILLLFVSANYFGRLYSDLKAYNYVQEKRYGIEFLVRNENLNVEYGKSFQLKLFVKSEDIDIGNVFLCYGGGEFLMDKTDSLFTYNFDMINNDIKFYFKTLSIESRVFQINVLPTPEITGYKVTYIPPKYTGIKSEILENIIDFRVLYGSVLKFELNLSNLDSLYLVENDSISLLELSSEGDFSKTIKSSGNFSLCGSNEFFTKKNLLNFSVICVPDLYPGIQVEEFQDSLRSSIYYFYGVITDDYGFSSLRFNYSVNNGTITEIPLRINKDNVQEFYFSFDFAEFAGMDRADIRYYFEIYDNDGISGPKSTRSADKKYLVPDLNSIFDYHIETDVNVNSKLREAENIAQDIVSGVKELQKKMLDNSVDDWEKQQLAKDIIEKKNQFDKLLETVREENIKKSSLNKSFTNQDSILLEKQKQVQNLLDNIMDEEMRNLINEFSELSEEFSKEKFRGLDEKIKLTFEQMSEELDRNIELLKRLQIEEKYDLLLKKLEKLKYDHNKIDELNSNKTVSNDSIAGLSRKFRDDLEKFKENYQNLLIDNTALEKPYHLHQAEEDLKDLSERINRQSENIESGRFDKDLSRDIKQKMEELSDKMKSEQNQNFADNSFPESDIELIIQNILIISLSQEELLYSFRKVDGQSSGYAELGRLQDLKRQEYKIVKDSLSVLAKSNLMLASLLSQKFYDIELKFGLLPKYIQDNKRSDLLREQQFIISYLNDIALSLSEAIEKNKEQRKGNGKNSENNLNPGKNKAGNSEGYNQMKQIQSGLKKQLEDLLSKMKNGEKGEALQQGISKMIRNNELFRKSLQDFISESGVMSNAEKQLLNEINRLLDENIKDIADYSISNQVINRNNQIYNKLLMSEKASKQREEFEEKRKAETAAENQYKRPETILDFRKKSGKIKTDFQKSDLKLNGYFKNVYENYYIKIDNE